MGIGEGCVGTTANRSHPYPSWVIHFTLKSAQLPAARNRVEPLQTGKETLEREQVAGDQMLLSALGRKMGGSPQGAGRETREGDGDALPTRES